MDNPYLLLWLEAPLQAWGHDSKFGRRDSLDFPTKSGVLGLLCCARGAGGEESAWLAEWADLDMHVVAYVPTGSHGRALRRQPLLRDFQMVGSGYDEQDPWQNLLIPKKSDGSKAVGGGTKMTYRYYLQDMAFAVALQAPVWDLYLGRKNCVPTEFIYQGIFDGVDDTLFAANELAQKKQRVETFRVLQGEHNDGEFFAVNDIPLRFGFHKTYRDRSVTVQRLDLTG